MVFWFPACVVIWERFSLSHFRIFRGCLLACVERCCGSQWTISMACYMKCSSIEKMLNEKERMFIEFVIKFRSLWFISLTLVAIASSFVVLYYPRLQLPNSTEFQLFDTSHLFEQYDLKFKHQFWFTRTERVSLTI